MTIGTDGTYVAPLKLLKAPLISKKILCKKLQLLLIKLSIKQKSTIRFFPIMSGFLIRRWEIVTHF